MFSVIFSFIATHILYFALHLESSSFPKPLSAREEIEAFAAFKAGDMAARDKLIQHNLRLVAHIVKKYYAQPGGQEDFISIGTIGLIKAVNSFDNTKGARFATYASRCIENEIRMTLRSAKKTQGDVSLHEPLENDKGSGALTIIDVMADEQDIRADYERKEEVEKLRALVKTLSGRERQIIVMRYGLAGGAPLTQQQVAGCLGISRSYVSRIEKNALTKLRKLFPAGQRHFS